MDPTGISRLDILNIVAGSRKAGEPAKLDPMGIEPTTLPLRTVRSPN